MIPQILAALAALPRLADSLERLATRLEQLGDKAREVQAANRKERKDEESDNAIDRVLDAHGLLDGEARERKDVDEPPRV